MQQTQDNLANAYRRTQLARHGISFDDAMANPMFKNCLTRVAQAIQKPHVPLPKHTCAKHWQDNWGKKWKPTK